MLRPTIVSGRPNIPVTLHCRTRARPLRWPLVWLLLIATCAWRAAHGADPLAYRVVFEPTGEAAVDEAMRQSAQLEALREKGPVGPFALLLRAREDAERVRTVLRSQGYYQGEPRVTIEGRPLEDPELPRLLADLPENSTAQVTVAAELGPRYRIGELRVEGDVPQGIRERLQLAPGDPAVADEVLAAGRRMEAALLAQGYALARVPPPVAYENPGAQTLDITYSVAAGPQVDLGEIRVQGLERLNEAFVRERLLVHPGERYDPAAIARARQDLLDLGVFSGVTVRTAQGLDPSGRLPLTFDVQERPRRVLGFNAAWSTDLGGSLGTKWSHRNLFGNAEQLNLSASVINLGGSATTGIGYNVSGQFLKPDFLQRDQSLEARVGALKQSLEAYDQTALLGGLYLNRRLAPRWTGTAGLSIIRQRITQQGISTDYTLLGLPMSVRYDSTGRSNPIVDPVRGVIASAGVTPTFSLAAEEGASEFFTIAQASASTYIDLARFGLAAPGRSVVAMRALVGAAYGASQLELPPDQRFYAGGSATVRGFRYQSIGPKFPDGTPAGGTAVDAASIELRQRIGESFGAVAFVDAGQVSESGGPFKGSVSVGAGVGVRYYTAIGPLRLDVAVPVTREEGDDGFQVYIGLGQAF